MLGSFFSLTCMKQLVSQLQKSGPLECNQLKQPTSQTRSLGFPFIKVQEKSSALTQYWLVLVWSQLFF